MRKHLFNLWFVIPIMIIFAVGTFLATTQIAEIIGLWLMVPTAIIMLVWIIILDDMYDKK